MFLITFLIFINAVMRAEDHALYLALVEIEVNNSGSQVLIKTFKDDFLDVMKNYNEDHNRNESDLSDNNSPIVEAYFSEKMVIGESSTLNLKESEIQGDSYWLTFETDTLLPKAINIKADFFMELFPTQQNVVITTWGDQKRSCRLALESPSCDIKF